jgi:predicted phosphodiesterase
VPAGEGKEEKWEYMNAETQQCRKEVIEALLIYNPSIPHRTAATLLFKDHPDLFRSVDNARTALRGYTGNQGKKNRNGYADKQLYRQPFTGEAMPIPTPFWNTDPFVFDTTDALFVADNHIPFHEEGAIELAVKHGKQRGAKDVVILGDFLDHYQESDFCKQPDVSTLTQELEDGREALEWLRKQFPKGRIIFKEGNHEERFAIKVHKCLPEAGALLDNFTYDKLGFKELNIELVNDRRRIDMGYLTAIHGHELGKGTAVLVNAARTLQLKAKDISICAHWHVPAQHRVRTLRRSHIGCWSLGCLCNLTPRYAPINDWELGFAVFHRIDEKGNFVIENKTIIGKMVV